MPIGSTKYQSYTQLGSSFVRNVEDKLRDNYSIADYGAQGNGDADDAAAINLAIVKLVQAGGGVLNLQNARTYKVNSPIIFPAGVNSILLEGNASRIIRGADMPNEMGVFDLRACSQVSFRNFTIDGEVLVSRGTNYSEFSGDPADPLLVKNTSIWIHGGCTDIDFDTVTVTHTGGYAAFSDTRRGGHNTRISFRQCKFINNRPHLFGVDNLDLNYGSWTGGIFYKGDCASPLNVFCTASLTVIGCIFERCTGNQIWGHNNGYFNFHSALVVANNSFTDIGLDCINTSCTTGGSLTGNIGRRVGYITGANEQAQSVPKYLPNLNATFIDHSGYCENVNITDNSCTSMCGGFCSLDGFAYGTVTGNSFRQPIPGDTLYVYDQIALIPSGVVYGLNCANTFGNTGGIIEQGGSTNVIVGNSFYNCTASAIIAIAVRNSVIANNDIFQPGDSTFCPILLGNQSTADYQRCYENSITNNRIHWSPSTQLAAIQEQENWSGSPILWSVGDANWIEGNHIFPLAGNAFEVTKAPSTKTLIGFRTGWLALDNQTTGPTAAAGRGFLYADATHLWLSLNGGAYVDITAGGGGAATPGGADGQVQFNNLGAFGGSANLGWTNSTATLTVTRTGAGSGIISPIFNGNIAGLSGSAKTFTNSDGSFSVDYLGHVLCQTAVASLVFNSLADVNGGNAFQTSTGTMSITGTGNGSFQNVTVHSVFTSAADVNGGNAFQTSTSTCWITGLGDAVFNNATSNHVFNSRADITGGAAFQTSTGTMSISGTGNGTFQNVTSAFVFSSVADVNGGNAFQTSTGTFHITGAGDGHFQNVISSLVFNSLSDINGGNAFQTSGGTMTITGAGNGSFQNLTVHSLFTSSADVFGGDAFKTSTSTCRITGSGDGIFANVTANLVFNSRADVNGGNAFQTSGGNVQITGTGTGSFQLLRSQNGFTSSPADVGGAGGGCAATGFNPYVGSTQYNGVASDSFVTGDSRTCQVRGGIIVSIV